MGKPNYEGSYSLGRQPAASQSQGVTLETIYRELALIAPELTGDKLDRTVLLFAMLKVGKAISKLTLFTKWPVEEIADLMATIDDPNLQYGSTVSTRYVLGQVPGSEDLIEAITGERVVAPEKAIPAAPPHAWEKNLVRPAISRVVRVASVPIRPVNPTPPAIPINNEERTMNTEIVNGAAEAEEVKPTGICAKTAECDRPAGHNGICKGQRMPRYGPSVKRAPKASSASAAPTPRAPRKVKVVNPAPAAKASKPAIATTTGHYSIEYFDGTERISYEGADRDRFLSTLDAIGKSLNGRSNG